MSKNTGKAPGTAGKSSSADYPVEPEERIKQEARLKKAAAAGANVLKSPLPGLRSALAPGVMAPPKAPELQAAPVQPIPVTGTVPNPPAVLPETAEAPVAAFPQTNDNAEILAELKRISAWADLQRRITKWSFICLGIFIPAAIGTAIFVEQRLQTKIESSVSPQQMDWFDVDRNVRSGDFEKAIATGEELVRKTPQQPEAHRRLAEVYLAAGNLQKAKEHYAEAFRLFPSEDNEKRLGAIQKRLDAESFE